jgi:hypothetical protein
MGATLSGKYTIGEPIEYISIYGYPKRRFPILTENSSEVVGHVKEELVLDGEKNEIGKVFYTRNLTRPYGQKRFYESVEALILAFGGEIARKKTVLKAVAGGKKTPRKKAAAPVKKTRVSKLAATSGKKPRQKKVA